MASALLFVALLVVVELSYRRWARRASARRRKAVVDLAGVERAESRSRSTGSAGDATVIPMPRRDDSSRAAGRNG